MREQTVELHREMKTHALKKNTGCVYLAPLTSSVSTVRVSATKLGWGFQKYSVLVKSAATKVNGGQIHRWCKSA